MKLYRTKKAETVNEVILEAHAVATVDIKKQYFIRFNDILIPGF